MFKKKKQKKLALIAFAAASMLWGVNTAAIKVGLESVPLFLLLWLRFVVAGVLLLPLAKKKWRKLSKKQWATIVTATIVGYVASMSLTYIGIQRTGGVNTSLLYLLAPVVLFAFSMKFLRESLNAKVLTGLIISLLGAFTIVVAPLVGVGGLQADLLGNLAILAAILCAVTGTIMIKPVLEKVPVTQLTVVRFLISGVALSPLAAHDLWHHGMPEPSAKALLAIGYSLVFATIIAYSLYHYGLKRLSGEETSVLCYLDPVFGVVASVLLLGESLTPVTVLGAGLTLWGIYLAEASVNVRHYLTFHHKH